MPANRILVCDDELPVVRAIEVKLRAFGFDLTAAFTVGDAWDELTGERPFDLVIAACPMKRADGLELARRMRSHDALRETPVLLLTGKGQELPSDDLIADGLVQRVVEKPFSPQHLVRDVRETLKGRPETGEPKIAPSLICPSPILGTTRF